MLLNPLALSLMSVLFIVFIAAVCAVVILVIHKKSQEKTTSEKIADNLEASNSSKTMGEFVKFIKEARPASYSIQGDFYE